MFYDGYLMLCREKGLTPSAAAVKAGLNKGTVSVWKKKWEQKIDVDPDKATIEKLSSFFCITEAKLRELTETYSVLAPVARDVVVNREFAELPIATRQAMLDGIKKDAPTGNADERDLDASLIRRLVQLTPEEKEKVDAFVQGILASR